MSEQTAEQLDQCEGFGRLYYEKQRRLSMAPKIGHAALELYGAHDFERRFKHELVDGIAEAIPGVVINERSYELINGELVAEDGQPMEELLVNGLRSAITHAARDSFYQPFWPQRARYELDEMRDWQKMANEEVGYNTSLAISPYSQEYCSPETEDKLEIAGQAPKEKRAMLRVGYWDGDKMRVLTRSIDNSSLELLKLTAKEAWGYEFRAGNSTQMLGERIKLNLTAAEMLGLVDKFVDKADGILAETKGGYWRQGRSVEDAIHTQRFVESQHQIIDNLCQASKELAARYSSYESFKEAWEGQLYKKIALIKENMKQGSTEMLVDVDRAADAAGAIAEARGETYNMCGLVISANNNNQPMQGTGFESVKSLIGKKIQCPECKEKVIVPRSKLAEGRLCCSQCSYEIDACTGFVYSKTRTKGSRTKPQPTEQKEKQETYWQRITRETKENQELKKAKEKAKDLKQVA